MLARLRGEAATAGKAETFARLRPFLMLEPAAAPYSAVAAALGQAEGALRVAVHRLRKRYRELLRDELAQTLADPSLAEEELRALSGAFGH